MTQLCRYCLDFYLMDDETMSLETDDGWGSDICRQCSDEINREEQQPLDDAWDFDLYSLSDENTDEGEPE